MEPQNPDLHIALGNFYAGIGKSDRAEAAFLKAVEVSPDSTKPRLVLAGFYDASGKPDDALSEYQKTLGNRPDDAMVKQAVSAALFQEPTG